MLLKRKRKSSGCYHLYFSDEKAKIELVAQGPPAGWYKLLEGRYRILKIVIPVHGTVPDTGEVLSRGLLSEQMYRDREGPGMLLSLLLVQC